MYPAFDIASAGASTLGSMMTNRERLQGRSWTGEFAFRLAKRLLQESLHHSHDWLRSRQELLAMQGPALFKVDFEEREIAGVTCLIAKPKQNGVNIRQTPIVYFHGGGYVVGSVKAYRYTLASLALACRRQIIAVDYRRVPEFPVPAPQKDCLAVVRALFAENQRELVLMGDSAGGALALSTLMALDEEERAHISHCVLWSPWVAPFSTAMLDVGKEHSDIVDVSILERWADELRQDEEQIVHLSFEDADFSGLPKTYIQAGQAEIMLPQIEWLSERLTQAGVSHELDIFPDQFHVFQTFLPLVREAETALANVAAFLD